MFNRNVGIILLIALAAGLGLLAAQKVFAPGPPAGLPATEAITFYPAARVLPDFNLAQSDGTRLIPGELKGHWTVVFLGFTFCPDVCPTTLLELAGAQKQWEAVPEGLRPRVLFVSVDPDRDSAARLGEYAHLAEMKTLDQQHILVHQLANRLMDLHLAGRREEALAGFKEVQAVADHIVELLQTIESKLRTTAV